MYNFWIIQYGFVFVSTIKEVVGQPGHYEFQMFANALEEPYRVHCDKAVLDKVGLLQRTDIQRLYLLATGQGSFKHSFDDYSRYPSNPCITIWASHLVVKPWPVTEELRRLGKGSENSILQ
ncbi:uncharacterized protein BYT42DRAFT_546657 [Radiomyces spectabilis]|uniref:uncharacterized protein n=1 Tax=Radiomyces spectabilis TaxID=64574 RepID=UPI00221F1A04|nr:uncharacterized protein BYT42DRAFT_546657 [Radiomyces spectabilis]KAI8375906.1 hypothetical protein BYT42DRAFT_546657 [Radiomyces spectabilis]